MHTNLTNPGSPDVGGTRDRRVVLTDARGYKLRPGQLQQGDIELRRNIPVVDYAGGALVVNLYRKTTWTTGAFIKIRVENISLDPWEPQTLFVSSFPLVAEVQISATDSYPALLIAELTSPLSSHLRVQIHYNGQTDPTPSLEFTLGVELLLREH